MFIGRLFSSIILLIVFFCAFLIKGPVGLTVFIIMGLFLSVFCIKEFTEFMARIDLKVYVALSAFIACLFFIGIIIENFINVSINAETCILFLGVFAVYIWVKVLFSGREKVIIYDLAATAFSIVSVIIPLNCLTLIYMSGYKTSYIGVDLALFLIIVTKAGDIGAYCTGTITSKRDSGNHKIVPSISPKKSWEGTLGGLITSILIAYIFSYILNINFGACNFLIVGIVGVVLFIGGFIGDLSESVFKRMTDIKDSGSVIPGIGGVLDLVDSLLINAPLFYIILKMFYIV
ncbi:MAG: phosphatidate cytidylyltransferase [Victivallales bacterium]|nr:phosphatidate cytidylyltransferase [Victivallales bacterium]MCF7889480.1 phosphatidate cytidylyltransferase [Victivallales bacterium]